MALIAIECLLAVFLGAADTGKVLFGLATWLGYYSDVAMP